MFKSGQIFICPLLKLWLQILTNVFKNFFFSYKLSDMKCTAINGQITNNNRNFKRLIKTSMIPDMCVHIFPNHPSKINPEEVLLTGAAIACLLKNESEAKPNKAYEEFVATKNEMLSKTDSLRDKQTINHWLRRENVDLFNWMLSTAEGKEALEYIKKYGRIGVFKAEKLFADNNISKNDIAKRLKESNPEKADI